MNADLRKIFENYKKMHRAYKTTRPLTPEEIKERQERENRLVDEIDRINSDLDFTLHVHRWDKDGAVIELCKVTHFTVGFDTTSWITIYINKFDNYLPKINWSALGSRNMTEVADFADMLQFARKFALTAYSELNKEFKFNEINS